MLMASYKRLLLGFLKRWCLEPENYAQIILFESITKIMKFQIQPLSIQPVFTCSKSAIETLEQRVRSFQS